MNHYEREYFVSRIRSGIHLIKQGNRTFKLLTPTLEEDYMSNEVFNKAYDEAVMDGRMSEDEMLDWMIEKGFWTSEKDQLLKDIKGNLEKLKIQCYEHRNHSNMLSEAKRYLRHTEKAMQQILSEKNEMFGKTIEGFATQEKSYYVFSRCCFEGDQLIDMENVNLATLYYQYNRSLLQEKDLRELSRNDPWKLYWIMKDHSPLFANDSNRILSQDQKGIVLWSNMYDNIQESVESPSEEVLNDDDMLDGWLIIQRKKARSEKAKAEMEKSVNSKIANSDEIMIMASSAEQAENIHSMNSYHAEQIRQQRLATVKARGNATDLDFQDRRLGLVAESNKQYLERVRGK